MFNRFSLTSILPHLLMTVPPYNLPRMHRTLGERGVLDRALVADNYWDVLERASSKAA